MSVRTQSFLSFCFPLELSSCVLVLTAYWIINKAWYFKACFSDRLRLSILLLITETIKKQPFFFFFHLLLLVGGYLLYNIVVVFAIHWHESAMDLHVFPIPIPPPTSLSIRSLWVFPVHQARALVSCIQPGLVICFTLDSILVSMLFSQNIPPLPSPTESKKVCSVHLWRDSLLSRKTFYSWISDTFFSI